MKEKEMSEKEKNQQNSRRVRCLSEDDCHKLFESCNEQLRPMVATALNNGMRLRSK